MSDIPDHEEIITIARLLDPTAASLLKNCLEAAGIPASVADANIVQANSFLTNAVGGVRVQVPASFVESAKLVIAEYENGAFQLEDGEAPKEEFLPRATDMALWGADISVILSAALTPLFGAWIHFRNSRVLGDAKLARIAIAWLGINAIVTAVAMYAFLSLRWAITTPFVASLSVLPYTFLWYMLAGYRQSKYISSNFGAKYRHKTLFAPAFIFLVALVCLGASGR